MYDETSTGAPVPEHSDGPHVPEGPVTGPGIVGQCVRSGCTFPRRTRGNSNGCPKPTCSTACDLWRDADRGYQEGGFYNGPLARTEVASRLKTIDVLLSVRESRDELLSNSSFDFLHECRHILKRESS
ncbi:hypothetical protein GCM10010329_28860 [Streptomyces spiroverticillatus]|uniref:Uncharacterized protein n=1 Tax=Streptomyces finlayi TaxID=67296 RepID=A0A918WVW7_9ACTN|nr:hypothetical protein GCM10010329_28860 [Streptomyces spiroverticillatus]GHC88511.1 hypothetical protein GCM10010334_21270 [Streptomyces finlayi]